MARLIPQDSDPYEWAAKHLVAFLGRPVFLPGANFQVIGLRPAKQSGQCVFLDDQDQCLVHRVAPFNCSHFDAHMKPGESARRHDAGVQARIEEMMLARQSLYVRVWEHLWDQGRRVEAGVPALIVPDFSGSEHTKSDGFETTGMGGLIEGGAGS